MNEDEAMVYVNWLRSMDVNANAVPGNRGCYGVSFTALSTDGSAVRSVTAWQPPSPQNEDYVERREMERINEMEMWGPAGRPQMPRGGW